VQVSGQIQHQPDLPQIGVDGLVQEPAVRFVDRRDSLKQIQRCLPQLGG